MNIDIRKSIMNNFKGNNYNEIKSAIESAVNDKDEITLPGLGVFFELLWKNSDEKTQKNIIETIQKSL